MRYSEICIPVRKLIVNLCLAQQKVFCSKGTLNLFKFWQLQAYFCSFSHVWQFKLPAVAAAGAHRVVFKPILWFFTATITCKSKDRHIASKAPILRTMKNLKFDPCKISVAYCLQPADPVSIHANFDWLFRNIHECIVD
jgi:hypothetical protein